MTVLAEISDKMPTIPQLWFALGVLSVLFCLPGFIHKRVAFIMFVLGTLLSAALLHDSYHVAFRVPNFSELVQKELGTVWMANDFASSLCPLFFTGLVLLWHLKKQKDPEK